VDGDGLNDLIVGAKRWYRQPAANKHDAANWTCYELGAAKWAMSCIAQDMDGDGDFDLLVQERKKQGTFYYVNPGREKATEPWAVKTIDPTKGCMFMVSGDVNGDGRPDLVKADPPYISIFIKTNDAGPPVYKEVKVEQPKQPDSVSVQAKPKGVALMELNGDPSRPEIMVIPEYEAQLWFLTVHGDGMAQENWACTLMDIPYPESRKKMDNVYLADVDGDGDLDVVTTEENGGWGVIWFENPERKK
jgi:FG-GAP-like repeat